MKKTSAIFFFLIYLNTSLGLGVDVRYCGRQITEIRLLTYNALHSSCGTDAMSKGCCRNEFHFCRTEKHRLQELATIIPDSGKDIAALTPNLLNDSFFTGFQIHSRFFVIPGAIKSSPGIPLYLFQRVLRI